MQKTLKINPVTRIEGHLEVEVTIDSVGGQDQVVAAHSGSPMFRGLETILSGRDPRDAFHLTQRVCGVCPVSHAMAASRALEDAAGVAPPTNGRILQNLILGANYLQSHILHFYHLMLPDFVNAAGFLDMSPWRPRYEAGDLLSGEDAEALVAHYVAALDMRRKAHRMGAVFGGRLPGSVGLVGGGGTARVSPEKVTAFRQVLDELLAFTEDVYLPDVEFLRFRFPAYASIGAGCGNLLSYGVFDTTDGGDTRLLARGRYTAGELQPVDAAQVREYVAHSWYTEGSGNLSPGEGVTEPFVGKDGAYSWLKAPRYEDVVHEVGPLARMWVNGDYRLGISVIDRIAARAEETRKVATAMLDWLDELETGEAVYQGFDIPEAANGVGLTEAPRGALGHWLAISGRKIERYQMVTPTGWNASPRDDAERPGALEQALVGTPVARFQHPLEVLRVIHSFDPCVACSVHTVRPGRGPVRGSRLLQLLLAVCLAIGLVGTSGVLEAQPDIQLVTIGDPGNPADVTELGAVASEYRIGKHEVTNEEYTAFLNAVAASDPHELYNPSMEITRSGDSGGYAYNTSQPRHPVRYVSWYDAARFVNWLHNGSPTGAQDATTTEDGAYTFSGPAVAGDRTAAARYFLPSEHEWYKAAYYGGGERLGYRDYPTVATEAPAASMPTEDANTANFDGVAGGPQDVGSYPGSESYYGTLDQAGNVWEWVETEVEGHRGLRGGSFDDYPLLFEAVYRDSQEPGQELEFIGFRIAARADTGGPEFVRGDVSQDYQVDLTDAVVILGYLYKGEEEPKCLSAGDTNDDGELDLTDGVFLLMSLYTEPQPLPGPTGDCGVDPKPDTITCESFAACPVP